MNNVNSPFKNVLEKLRDVKQSGNSWKAPCPAHDDQKPSLSEDPAGWVPEVERGEWISSAQCSGNTAVSAQAPLF
jgi:hypothetical protein